MKVGTISATTWILAASCALFLLSPYLPTALLKILVGNTPMALALLLLSLYVLRINVTLGLAVFLASCALFLENRRRIVTRVQTTMARQSAGAPVEVLNKPAEDLVPGEVHPEHESPVIDEVGYEPSDQDRGGPTEDAHGAVEDEKGVLEGVPSNDSQRVAEGLRAHGFA